MNLENTYYFSIPGGVPCPSPGLIIVPQHLKQEVAFVLDTNICIDIEDAANGKLNPKATERLTDLIVRIGLHDAHVVPTFGLFERALDKATLAFDWNRYQRHCIEFPIQWDKVVKELALGMAPRFSLTMLDESAVRGGHMAFLQNFQPAYASFLKIILIDSAFNGLSPIAKLKLYLEWMLHDLDLVILFPLQTAICFFAGDASGTRMFNLKKKHPMDAAWGAAFDQFLLMVTHQYHLTKVVNKPTTIFVSNDEATAAVMEMSKVRAVFTEGDQIVSSANEISFDFLAYKDMSPINDLIDKISQRQKLFPRQPDSAKIQAACKKLLSEAAVAFPR